MTKKHALKEAKISQFFLALYHPGHHGVPRTATDCPKMPRAATNST